MRTTTLRRVSVMGGILAATLAAGCFGGGGYSNSPYGYNGTFYTSRPYSGGYGNPYPYNRGYNDTHAFPQSFGNSNSYSAGLQHGVPAEASRDSYHERKSEQHVAAAVTRPPDQARNERGHTSIDRDKDSRKD
jgi:hypothetical protein